MHLRSAAVQINVNAPFSEAFHHILEVSNNPSTAKKVFLNVASRIVSVGALTGEGIVGFQPCSRGSQASE